MVELRVKVSNKGQILIPKIFRKKYGINEGQSIIMEPTSEGLLLRGKPSPDETMDKIQEHVKKVRDMKVKGPKLGDLKKVYLEIEFEEGRH
ncbi:MAG: AbrB/MazE/SpoVT family DNA-binding domain-containing protein [Candidatus Geothermarchaeales archaeon]